jgi:hypothetical protein
MPPAHAGFEITGIGKTSCKDLPLHPFHQMLEAGKARGQARPAMSRDALHSARTPRATARKVKSLLHNVKDHDHQVAKRPANPVSILWVAAFDAERNRRPGGARRDRTDDLLLAKQALSQLSYGPDTVVSGTVVPDTVVSNTLCQASARWASHPRLQVRARDCGWWAWVDSNYRPHAYQACALTRLSYRPDRGESRRSQSNPGRKRNEDGETRLMGPDKAPDFSIDASIEGDMPPEGASLERR